jgi:hydroxypyruvate reductase
MARFDLTPHRNDPRRLALLGVAESALEAIDPHRAVTRSLRREGETLHVADRALNLASFERVVVLGLGKASVAMGRAVCDVLADKSPTGAVVTNAAGDAGPLDVVVGAHPVPDATSVAAGTRLLAVAHSVGPLDLAVVVISGGGSALATVPARGLSLDDLRRTSTILLRSGATINELNAVRKHLSAIKGGRLAQALAGAGALVTLILSDVVGNPLDVIASGPTVPDPTTASEALKVITSRGLASEVPRAVHLHLFSAGMDPRKETPTGGGIFDRQILTLVADAATAADAAAAAGREAGYDSRVATTELQGEAREVAHHVATGARGMMPGQMLVYAGETTVTVTGDGRGGRNQELALAASTELIGRPDIVILSVGTDGIDGMSPAAGGFGNATAVDRGAALGLDAADYLARNDSYGFLRAVGDVVTSGPTGTNVGDLIIALRAE